MEPKGTLRTMEELSAAAGVSRPTVSKYFADPRSLRPASRERIERALAEHDFAPNLLARNLNPRRSRLIGLIAPSYDDPFYAEILRVMEDRVIAGGYLPIVLSSHGDPGRELRLLAQLGAMNVVGLAIAPVGGARSAEALRRLAARTPVVLADARLGLDAPFVGGDNRASVALAVDHLLARGEAPAFLPMPPVNANAAEREAAYREALLRRGVEPRVLPIAATPRWDFERVGRDAMRAALARPGRPRAVLCANDRIAVGALSAAWEAGVSVGPDAALRIMGHDDSPMSRWTCPPLTTVAQDLSGLAAAAVARLLRRVQGQADAEGDTLLQGALVLRASA